MVEGLRKTKERRILCHFKRRVQVQGPLCARERLREAARDVYAALFLPSLLPAVVGDGDAPPSQNLTSSGSTAVILRLDGFDISSDDVGVSSTATAD